MAAIIGNPTALNAVVTSQVAMAAVVNQHNRLPCDCSPLLLLLLP